MGKFGGKLATILIGLGLLAIALAWNGAASTIILVQQLPFLISGGLIGIALVGVGCALMIVQSAREDRARLEERLDRIAHALAGGVSGVGGSGTTAPADLHGLVAAGSASYHVPGCRLVDGREEVAYLTPEEARARFLQACRVCQPESSNVTVV